MASKCDCLLLASSGPVFATGQPLRRMGCHAARFFVLAFGLLCALEYPWRTLPSTSSPRSRRAATDTPTITHVGTVLVDAHTAIRLPAAALSAGALLSGDDSPLGEQLLAGFSALPLDDDKDDPTPSHSMHTYLPEAAPVASFLGLHENSRLVREKSGFDAAMPLLRQSTNTVAVPASAVLPSASQAAHDTNKAPGQKAEPSAAPLVHPPAMLQIQDHTRGIGTILAGAGLSTLLGGANQYQMGPFAPATPTAPGMMPGGTTVPAAPALGVPGAVPAMAAAPAMAGPATPASDGDDHHVAAIAIGVIGGLIALCLVGGCIYTMMKRKKKR
ncbi:transmembrane protein [Cystoisospora suis]|uniref:Transmembrane protein n=1 Tax=Cystoisospora suis TaxID=483139 RepID=A0A2C6KZ28_9APIC|nr:transmembrane protein [Cystoisospora suis]